MQNDDEWLDYANQKKDYSGLKIETLKIEDSDRDDQEHEFNEDGEKVRIKRKDENGPWNKQAQGAESMTLLSPQLHMLNVPDFRQQG